MQDANEREREKGEAGTGSQVSKKGGRRERESAARKEESEGRVQEQEVDKRGARRKGWCSINNYD